ncbi:MAG: NUDIX hydrolase [Candidatus Kerfeldbacteria bacterium]|nr:NUDIX hydrolase [Candidatus Kerfeldbacteria bacterium]
MTTNRHRRIRGVALIVINPSGHIMVLQELEDKPHLGKYAGMWSIPMETLEPSETHYAGLRRLMTEELPGLRVEHLSLDCAPIGCYRIAAQVWVTLYVARASTFDLPKPNGDREVGQHEWVPIAEGLNRWLRRGAAEMIEDYADRYSQVRRTACRNINRPSS